MGDYRFTGGMGVYTYNSQFDLDERRLLSQGFTQQEINALKFLVQNDGRITVNNMVQGYNIPYEEAQKIKYMYDICTGRVSINSDDDISKHLRRMFGKHKRIGIQDLATSSIGEIGRTAMIAGIPTNTPFAIWNSKNYPPLERLYKVVGVSQGMVTIATDRIPRLKYKQSKSIPGILEIKENPVNGIMKVAISKDYCRLCNRFIVVASLRRPEFHLGMVQIICVEGTRIYVYAETLPPNKNSKYYSSTQRIYDYGYFQQEINHKLLGCATRVYRQICGVTATTIPANMDYKLLADIKNNTDDEAIEID